MPPKRQRKEQEEVSAPTAPPSLAFLCSAKIVRCRARAVCRSYEIEHWAIPAELCEEGLEHLRDAFMHCVNMNPWFGWCTICMNFCWMPRPNVRAGPCWRCVSTDAGRAEPVICELTRRVLLRWGHTYDEQGGWAWHNARAKMLTASDAYVTIGIKGFKSKPKLYREKAGLEAKQIATATMMQGNINEPIIRQKYSNETGKRVYMVGLIPLDDHPWLGASPDGITNDGIMVEIKSPKSRAIGNGMVPPMYMPQVQLQLQSIGATDLDFVQFRKGQEDWPPYPDEYAVRRVKRSDQWFEQKLPLMREFYETVQNAPLIKRAVVRIIVEALRASKTGAKNPNLEDAIRVWQDLKKHEDPRISNAAKWSVKRKVVRKARQPLAESEPTDEQTWMEDDGVAMNPNCFNECAW
jgi:putative phage-type endonuclease